MWDQDIGWPGIGVRKEGIFILSGCQVAACSHLEEVIPYVVVTGYPLTMGPTHNGMVTQVVTWLPACWAGATGEHT